MSLLATRKAQDLSYKADALAGISEKTITIHHDKLYVGYVNKMKAIAERIETMTQTGQGLESANQTESELRELRLGETFATNGVYLHERYFGVLGGTGEAQGPLVDAIVETWGSMERFLGIANATALAMRGWVVLAWDTQLGSLKLYGGDAHNHGGVWGCIPLVSIDVYEHAYFIDFGSDRAAYLKAFWQNLDWARASATFEQAKTLNFSL